MRSVFHLHGLIKSIVSDRDPCFTSEMYSSIFKKLGVDLKFSTANHPQMDGLTERVHQTIKQILRATVHHRQTNWEEVLPLCEFKLMYHDMIQASTCETPFYMNYGSHPVSIPEFALASPQGQGGEQVQHVAGMECLARQRKALEVAKDSIREALDDQIAYADCSRKDVTFKVGEMVLIHRDFLSTDTSQDQPCAKLAPRWLA